MELLRATGGSHLNDEGIARLMRKLLWRGYAAWMRLRSRYWVWRLQLDAWFWGGEAQCHSGVRIRQAVRFQGKGRVVLSAGVVLGDATAGAPTLPILLQPRNGGSIIRVGERTTLTNGIEIIAMESVTIGADCAIGARTCILDADFHGVGAGERRSPGLSRPVEIGDNVWIGMEAMITKGARIGSDAVVGARTVVSKDVAPGSVVVGGPMRVLRSVYERASQSAGPEMSEV